MRVAAQTTASKKAPTMPDPPNPTGQWKRTGPKPNVEKATQQDMRDFFGSGSSSAATQSSAASLPKAGTSADPIDAPEEPIHTPVPESAEKHGGPAAPTPYEELPHSAGLTLSFLLSMLSPVLFGNADSGTRRVASRQVNRRLAPELLAGQLWHGYSTTPAFDSELPVLVAGLSSSRAASLLRHLVCNWYKRQKQLPLTFLYGAKDGVSDSKQYSLEHALALVEMVSSQDSEHCTLRDSAQERKLDAALKLTMPSLKKGSKKTRGEEQQQTLEARTERENMAAPPPAAKRPRGEPYH